MDTPQALIVDDEPDICELLSLTLEKMGLRCHTATSLKAARALLNDISFDICLTDMRLPDGNGLDFISEVQRTGVPIAVITAHGNIESAVTALKRGAFDFLSKPIELAGLRALVEAALKKSSHGQTAEKILIGQSDSMQALRQTIQKVSHSQAPIYISGPSGSGKERVARLVHACSPRADGPFVPVNCGAIPEPLMESEFFGHQKGSFTGAYADKQGLFQAASGGTLFLDEVADLPLDMQVKLLRAIQEKNIKPIGATTEIPVDVRILSATHQALQAQVEGKLFRQDLFYRLNVIELKVPGLQEHQSDIPDLISHILHMLSEAQGRPEAVRLSPEAEAALQTYPFPGNVRELENILERAFTLCNGLTIGKNDLQLPSIIPAASPLSRPSDMSLEDYLLGVEEEAILEALKQCQGNKTKAAKLLGLSFRSLRYRLSKLSID